MPALPPVPGVIKIELLWNLDGLPAANIIHWAYTGDPPTADDCGIFATQASEGFWTADLQADYNTLTVHVGARVTDLSSDTGATNEYDSGLPGLDGSPTCPVNCAALINHQILRRYRGGHPRTYFPPPTHTQQGLPNQWSDGFVGVLQEAWVSLYGALNSLTSGSTTLGGPVSVSYVTAGAPRVDPVVDPIVGSTASGMIRTQRRRLTASSY